MEQPKPFQSLIILQDGTQRISQTYKEGEPSHYFLEEDNPC